MTGENLTPEMESLILEAEKRTLGETPQTQTPPLEADIPTAELLQPILEFAFDSLAPAWQVKPAEIKLLADAYAKVLDKYLPDGLGKFGIEMNALLITIVVFKPRLELPRYDVKETKPVKAA